MQVDLRDYQQRAVGDAVDFVSSSAKFRRRLYSAPTGTGKGTIQLAVQAALGELGHEVWIITPSLEIVRGFLERQGIACATSASGIAVQAAGVNISTPIRLRNALLDGMTAPDVILWDESHHAIGDTVSAGDLFGLCPAAWWLGYTATPYRGSPRGTAALVADWGEPVVLLTVLAAIEQGYMARPTFHVEPLFDDDQLEVRNGEFVVVAAEEQLMGEVEALAQLVADQRLGPTAVAVPSSNIAAELRSRLALLGIQGDWVNQATPAAERAACYERCKAEESVLIDIATLAEGVDFPFLRTLIDAQPTLSPVRWMQRVGRIMRPKPDRPRLVTTNRNLERHAYLMQGGVPRRDVLAAMRAFGSPSNRLGKRVGLESLHKFKCVEVPTKDDGVALMYSLSRHDKETGARVDRIVILDAERTICGEARHELDATSKRVWGRYRRCDVWTDMAGFRSKSATGAPRVDVYPNNENLSVKQANWWTKAAARRGLDVNALDEIDRRQFDALPALEQMGERLG